MASSEFPFWSNLINYNHHSAEQITLSPNTFLQVAHRIPRVELCLDCCQWIAFEPPNGTIVVF